MIAPRAAHTCYGIRTTDLLQQEREMIGDGATKPTGRLMNVVSVVFKNHQRRTWIVRWPKGKNGFSKASSLRRLLFQSGDTLRAGFRWQGSATRFERLDGRNDEQRDESRAQRRLGSTRSCVAEPVGVVRGTTSDREGVAPRSQKGKGRRTGDVDGYLLARVSQDHWNAHVDRLLLLNSLCVHRNRIRCTAVVVRNDRARNACIICFAHEWSTFLHYHHVERFSRTLQ